MSKGSYRFKEALHRYGTPFEILILTLQLKSFMTSGPDQLTTNGETKKEKGCERYREEDLRGKQKERCREK
jgi:hypothetical protein